MSTRHKKNNRKRTRESLNDNNETKDISPPHKKQKLSSIDNNENNANTNIANKSIKSPQSQPLRTSPLQAHDEEEKAEETEHAIHTDSVTPDIPPITPPNTSYTSYTTIQNKQQNTKQKSKSKSATTYVNNHNELGHLMSGHKPGWLTPKSVIINQLREMGHAGYIPKDLQQQMQQYDERKKFMNNHIQNRTQSVSKHHKYPIQPIITDNEDEFDTEESWNCNLIICCVMTIIFVISIYALNKRFDTDYTMYCDTEMVTEDVINCTQCPQNAYCAQGIAKCNVTDIGYKLHAFKGCLPKQQYNTRVNGEILYMQIHDVLKGRRRMYINCDKSITYGMREDEMKAYFKTDPRNDFGMNERELNDAMNELFDRILEEPMFKDEIRFNCSSDAYYARLPQWELDSSKNCTKMNMLLIARTYGMELSVAVVCIAGMLVWWRKVTRML